MTKKELIENLKDWPDHAEVNLGMIPEDGEDTIWYGILEVEKCPEEDDVYRSHCLIYFRDIVMG